MRFLVTGISGFVSPYLARHLLNNGHIVYGLLHNTPSKVIKDVDYVVGDLCEINSLTYLKEYKFDGIFNLGALTHPPTSFKEPQLYFKTNALGAVNICEVFGENSLIMNCSSPEVYGICP